MMIGEVLTLMVMIYICGDLLFFIKNIIIYIKKEIDNFLISNNS